MAAAMLAVALAPVWWWSVPACAVMGLGFYMMHNTLQTNATQMAPERRGTAVAAFACCFFLGQSVGVGAAGLVVASEIPTARLWPGLDLSVDPTALGLYLLRNLRNVPEPWTFWKGLRRLPPGHALIAEDGRVVKQWRYWQPRFDTRPVTAEEVRAVFDEAVALVDQLVLAGEFVEFLTLPGYKLLD